MRIIYLLTLLIGVSIMTSCGKKGSKASAKVEERSANIIYTNWSEGIAVSYLVKNILTDKLDYNVTIKLEDIDKIYPMVANGEYDIFLDAWLPNTHASYFNQYGENLTRAGKIFDNAVAGLTVPSYAGIDNISELNKYSTRIYGIDSTSGVVQNTIRAIGAYKLNASVITGTETEMLSALDDAYKRREPVVITGWKPHQMFSKYDLKFLTDSKDIYGDSEAIEAVVNTAKLNSDPVLTRFLKRFTLTDRQLASLISEVLNHPEGEDAGARSWMHKNRIIISRWTKNLFEFEEKPL